ncbi:heme peroxidase [Lenzites betulinus]|nr:heme peroxidase [Lenzites betulinus]
MGRSVPMISPLSTNDQKSLALLDSERQRARSGRGADPSIASFSDIETAFHPNIGLDEIVALQKPFIARHDLSIADLYPAPDGLVPEPFHTPDQIFDRLADASQGEFDPILTRTTRMGLPFDSTPELWDTQFFLETQLRGTAFPGSGGNQGEVESAVAGELRLQSDHTIARDSRTACEWQSFVDNQPKAQAMFQFVFHDLSLFGQNVDDLVNCTEVVPISAPRIARTETCGVDVVASVHQSSVAGHHVQAAWLWDFHETEHKLGD